MVQVFLHSTCICLAKNFLFLLIVRAGGRKMFFQIQSGGRWRAFKMLNRQKSKEVENATARKKFN